LVCVSQCPLPLSGETLVGCVSGPRAFASYTSLVESTSSLDDASWLVAAREASLVGSSSPSSREPRRPRAGDLSFVRALGLIYVHQESPCVCQRLCWQHKKEKCSLLSSTILPARHRSPARSHQVRELLACGVVIYVHQESPCVCQQRLCWQHEKEKWSLLCSILPARHRTPARSHQVRELLACGDFVDFNLCSQEFLGRCQQKRLCSEHEKCSLLSSRLAPRHRSRAFSNQVRVL
jgi:hypothetical protein